MAGRKISLLVLAVFIVGTFLLIYIQYNASKNISNLIDGNEMMLKEFTVNTTLLDMEKEIAAVENIVRETMITNDTTLVHDLPAHQQKIESGLAQLKDITKNDSSVVDINLLNTLVQRKLSFSAQVLDSFRIDGSEAARKLLSTGASRRLSDSILQVTQKIDHIREQHLADIIQLMDRGGKKAQRLGMWLVILVLVSAAGFLWYIVTIIRKQMSLIRQLDAANRKQQSLIEELDASEKKVREAANIREKLMANMSHEIRTPMIAIVGLTQLLQQKKLDAATAEPINTIRQASENLLAISNDMLDLSKMEAGKLPIEKAPFNIRTLLQTIVGMMQPKIAEKNLELLATVDETVPETLLGDGKRLTQILVNLMGNSIKFTQRGSITVKILHEGMMGDAVKTGIAVSDTGIGIEKDKLPEVFDRFQQVDNAITQKYGGTGLGLAIVEELVHLQQGSIAVNSEPGKGTTFRLMIPYQLAEAGIPVREEPVEESIPLAALKDVRILVVDDDPMNQLIMQKLLENWGIFSEIAYNGKEAIDKLKVAEYDLILMDVQMPVMNGLETTRYIRNELHSIIPIFAMSSSGPGVREECMKAGMTDYISKPIQLKELNRIIEQYTPSRKRIIPVEGETAQEKPAKEKSAQGESAQGEPSQGKPMRERPAQEKGTPQLPTSYEYLNLEYMQEVGNGNKDYERSVTEQFLKMMPEELASLEKAQAENDVPRIKQIAHNMRTTISVMGLNEKLQPFLDRLEYEELSKEDLQNNLQAVKEIGEAALTEAKQFYAELIIAQ